MTHKITQDWINALRRLWRDMKVIFDGTVYTVLDVDSNGMLLIDKPDEYKATTAVPISRVKLMDKQEPTPEGDKSMNPFAKSIRQQLLEYQSQLVPGKEYAVVSAQIRGYRLGLETCLNRSFVAMMFYDVFGDQVF